ncbi:MAG: RNA polymerase sigma factor [Thiogranum sp.]
MPNNTCLVATFGAVETRKALTARSDTELIVMVRERGLGWKLAFNVLLGRHRDWLLRHCVYRLGNRHDAQDVTQQVILRAWQAIDRFEGRSAFRTWLYTIAENQCRSFAVKRMRYVQTEHIESLINLYLEGARSNDAECYARNQAVAAALQNVSDKAREVLLLRFYRECSLEEIATTLTISLSAAKMRLYRSLDQFKAEYLQVVGDQAAAA